MIRARQLGLMTPLLEAVLSKVTDDRHHPETPDDGRIRTVAASG